MLPLNFPRDVRWRFSKLTSGDVEYLRYLNSSPWLSLGGPKLCVIDGAKSIAEDSFDRTIPNIERCALKIRAMAQSIQAGADFAAALILADVGDGRLVVIEGNHRATAFVIANVRKPIAALIGSSPEMAVWANQTWR